MPCYQQNTLTYAGLNRRTQTGYATEADCLNACKEGACCESNGTCSVKPQCQCQGIGQTFKGVGTTCDPKSCGVCGTCFQTFGSVPTHVSVRLSGTITMSPWSPSFQCVSPGCNELVYEFDDQVTLALTQTSPDWCLVGSYLRQEPTYMRVVFNMVWKGPGGGGFSAEDSWLFVQRGHPCQVACAYAGVDIRQSQNNCNRSWWEMRSFPLSIAIDSGASVSGAAYIVGFQT